MGCPAEEWGAWKIAWNASQLHYRLAPSSTTSSTRAHCPVTGQAEKGTIFENRWISISLDSAYAFNLPCEWGALSESESDNAAPWSLPFLCHATRSHTEVRIDFILNLLTFFFTVEKCYKSKHGSVFLHQPCHQLPDTTKNPRKCKYHYNPFCHLL